MERRKAIADDVFVAGENVNEKWSAVEGNVYDEEGCERASDRRAGESGSDVEGECASAKVSESCARCHGRATVASEEAGNEVGVIGKLSGAEVALLVSAVFQSD